MATLTIRNLDDQVKQRLREQAAQHDRSMEAEARAALAQYVAPTEAVPQQLGLDWFTAMRERMDAAGGEYLHEGEFDDLRSHDMPRPADFGWGE